MSRLRRNDDGEMVCDDVSFVGGSKHCCGTGKIWGCPHIGGDERTCNFDKERGETLYAICQHCDKTIKGIPYETMWWVFDHSTFCNTDHFDEHVAETGNALEEKEYEMDEEE